MAWSQDTVIKGRFVDHNQQPIPRVKVQIISLNTVQFILIKRETLPLRYRLLYLLL